MNVSLADAYQAACTTPSDIYEHLPVFVQTCLDLDAETVIELGTRGGVSTVAWLYGLEQTGGRLWSVDIDPAPAMTHPRWTFLQGDDLDPVVFTSLPAEADVVFIDTSHQYEQTRAELHTYRWKVRPGGRILLHDTELARPLGMPAHPRYPVKAAVEEFVLEEGLSWSNLPNCWGLGIISIPEE
jgi:predicted O-methyltransferase YrrM